MTAQNVPTTVDESEDRLTPDLLKLALVIIVGTFVVQMDATMVNVALNTLRQSFTTTVSTIQWISTGYLLSMAMTIPLAGWTVDRFGAKRTWMTALAVFLIGSVLCGIAWSAGSLIAFRVVQGVGGGILLPLSQAILAQAAGPKRLGRLMAVVGIPALLGPIVGPIVGGVLVDDLSWRSIFYINAPIFLIAILLSRRIMSSAMPSGASKLDALGLALLSPALAGIVYGLSEAGNHGSFSDRHALIPLIAAGVLLVGFIVHALRSRIEPIIDLRLLRSRTFAASSLMLFLIIVSLLGAMLLVPLYYQTVRGDSALHAGLLLAPQGVGAAVAIGLCGGLVDRFSPRPIAVTGVITVITGMLAYTQVGPNTSTLFLGAALALTGAGFGAVVVPATAVAYRGLHPEAIPRATSALRIFQQIGSSFGVAMLAIVLQGQITDAVRAAPAGRVGTAALAHAYGTTFWWAAAFTAAALVPALLLSGRAPSASPGSLATPGEPAPDRDPESTIAWQAAS